MKVFLERVNSDYLFEVENKNGQKVLLDNSSKTSGKVEGVSPMELLLMGVAGCSAIDIIHILKKGRHEIRSYSSEVVASRREEMPRIFDSVELVITVDTDASDAVLERAVELTKTKYCSAFAVLEASVKVGLKLQRA